MRDNLIRLLVRLCMVLALSSGLAGCKGCGGERPLVNSGSDGGCDGGPCPPPRCDGGPCPPPPCGHERCSDLDVGLPACVKDADCQGGRKCVDMRCREVCNKDRPCGDNAVCCEGACFTGSCCNQSQCGGGLACNCHQCEHCLCDSDCDPGNICSGGVCTPGCSNTNSCGDQALKCCGFTAECALGAKQCNGACVTAQDHACCGDFDCTAPAVCAPNHRCMKPCTTPEECGGGEHCCGDYCMAGPCVGTRAFSGRTATADVDLMQAQTQGLPLFGSIQDIILDEAGNVFFTDYYSSGLRVMNRSQKPIGRVQPGQIGQLAGGALGCGGTTEFGAFIGLTRDRKTGDLYAADYTYNVIWKFAAPDYATGTVIAGDAGRRDCNPMSATTFCYAQSLTFGVDGYLYATDQIPVNVNGGNRADVGRLWQITPPAAPAARGTMKKLIDLPDFPIGVAMNSISHLFVGYYFQKKIVEIILPPKPNDPPVVRDFRAGLAVPGNTLRVAAGDVLYAALNYPSGAYRITANGATPIPGTGGAWAVGLSPREDELWVGGGHVIGSPGDMNNLLQGGALANGVWTPEPDLRFGKKGVPPLDATGPASDTTSYMPYEPSAVAIDGNGDVWTTESIANRVRRTNVRNETTSYGSGLMANTPGSLKTAEFYSPVAIGGRGNDIYVVQRDYWLSRIDVAKETVTNVIKLPYRPYYGSTIAVDKTGKKVYVGAYFDSLGIMVAEQDNNGLWTARWLAGTQTANGCAAGPPGTGTFGRVLGIAIDDGGFLYVADGGCGVRRVNPNTGEVEKACTAPGIYGLAFDDQQALYAMSAGKLSKLDKLTCMGKDVAGAGGATCGNHFKDGPASEALFWNAGAIAWSPVQKGVVIADTFNARLRVFYP